MIDMDFVRGYFPPQMRENALFDKHMLKEYLQSMILDFLSSTPYMRKMAFIGGTNLRLIKGIDRFSEDLDFDCKEMDKEEFMRMTDEVLTFLHRRGRSEGSGKSEIDRVSAQHPFSAAAVRSRTDRTSRRTFFNKNRNARSRYSLYTDDRQRKGVRLLLSFARAARRRTLRHETRRIARTRQGSRFLRCDVSFEQNRSRFRFPENPLQNRLVRRVENGRAEDARNDRSECQEARLRAPVVRPEECGQNTAVRRIHGEHLTEKVSVLCTGRDFSSTSRVSCYSLISGTIGHSEAIGR